MKQLLLSFVLLIGTLITNATETKPLPWDRPITKSYKVCSPISTLDIWVEPSGTPYGKLVIMVKRPFPYTTCEYTSIAVWFKTKFRWGGTPRNPNYQWIWTWLNCSVTIDAYSDTGFTYYTLQEGEEVDVNTYISQGYLDYCY